MFGRNTARRGLVAAVAVVAAACQDSPTPSGPPAVEPSLSRAAAAQQAASAFDRASAEVLALPGTVFADYNEITGRLEFGVENEAAIPGVQMALRRLGLSSSAYGIEITKPIIFATTLRDVFRPTRAGIQIHFGQYVCTMGFNVDHESGERSFITNSHCTNTQGGVEGTEYAQPSRTIDPTVIAVEVADPQYFKGGVCPRGKKCRYSDASRARYGATLSNRGEIARTIGPNTGSLVVDDNDPFFTVTSQDDKTTNFPIGITVNKVGRTTGWTQGAITRTCVNTSVQGSQVMQLCQTFVSDPGGATVVGGGASGSGVFTTSGSGVQLVGILWGGSSDNKTFVFSPLASIERELGQVNAIR